MCVSAIFCMCVTNHVQVHRTRKAIALRYAANGQSSRYLQPKECCRVSKQSTEYDYRFRANVANDMCVRAPAGSQAFENSKTSEDGRVVRSKEVQDAFLQNIADSPIKWQFFGCP